MRKRLAGWLLFFVTLGLFLPALRNGFVSFDDPDYVTRNPQVRAGLTWEGVRWAFRAFYASNWHPLTWLSHMADCQIYGLEPWGHHLTNVLLHAASTLVLFLVLRRMTGSAGCSLFAAALFGVHPLRVESVAWVAERKDVLSALFWMLTLWAYAQWTSPKEQGGGGRREGIYYGLALAFFFLGLLSKAMLVTLPFALLLLDYWPLGRLSTGQPFRLRAGRLVLEKVPFFVISAAVCAVTFVAQRRGGGMADVAMLPWPSRIENAFVSYWLYLGKLIYPAHLAVFYPLPEVFPIARGLAAGALLAAITALLVARRRQHPYLIVGWLWFLGTLIPVIGLVQVGSQSMADRYTYLPSIGICIMVAWGAAELTAGWRRRTALLPWAGAALLGVLALMTVRQIGYWADSDTLFRHALAVTKGNWLALNNVGVNSLKGGRAAEARTLLEEAAELQPENAEIRNNLGGALAAAGAPEAAQEQFEEAVRLKPDSSTFRRDLAGLHYTRANSLAAAGRLPEAIARYQAALQVDPDWAEPHNNFGNALVRAGRSGEAIAEFEAALRLKPEFWEAHYNLGNALANAGNLPEAIAHYREALRINPGYLPARHNLEQVQAAASP